MKLTFFAIIDFFSEFFSIRKSTYTTLLLLQRTGTRLHYPRRKILPLMCRGTSGPASPRRSPGAGVDRITNSLRLQEQAGDRRSDPSSGQFAGELQEVYAVINISANC